ncbi:MAG: hypothetical protein FJX71_01130 [Alphaproteobacteria bacterium]|nr:hypothetical protein [Alphaproteobacteria bacterium]
MLTSNLPLNLSTFLVVLTPILTYSLRSFFPQNMDKFNSMAGGLGIVAIIVAMMPGIVSTIPLILTEDHWTYLTTYPRVSYVVFLTILFGFFIMYTLEKFAHDKTKRGEDPSNLLYYTHLSCLGMFLFVAVSVLPPIAKGSTASLYLFSLVICFEIFLEENGLIRHYKERFHNGTRALIVGFGLLGYFFGVHMAENMPHLFYAGIQGIIAGAFLLCIVKTEFALLEQSSHFPTFLLSALFKIILLFLIFFVF